MCVDPEAGLPRAHVRFDVPSNVSLHHVRCSGAVFGGKNRRGDTGGANVEDRGPGPLGAHGLLDHQRGAEAFDRLDLDDELLEAFRVDPAIFTRDDDVVAGARDPTDDRGPRLDLRAVVVGNGLGLAWLAVARDLEGHGPGGTRTTGVDGPADIALPLVGRIGIGRKDHGGLGGGSAPAPERGPGTSRARSCVDLERHAHATVFHVDTNDRIVGLPAIEPVLCRLDDGRR